MIYCTIWGIMQITVKMRLLETAGEGENYLPNMCHCSQFLNDQGIATLLSWREKEQ